MLCGGDIIVGDGSGGESIYGGTFEDENYIKQHTGPGILSMSNGGPDSNNSQFMICMKKCFGLDDVHVVFGQVVEGLDVLKSIMEEVQTYSGKLSKPVVIVDCGQISNRFKRFYSINIMVAFLVLMIGVFLYFVRLDLTFRVRCSLRV